MTVIDHPEIKIVKDKDLIIIYDFRFKVILFRWASLQIIKDLSFKSMKQQEHRRGDHNP
jgi:hypothetical protein